MKTDFLLNIFLCSLAQIIFFDVPVSLLDTAHAAMNVDIMDIGSKITTSGILVYIGYKLDKRLEETTSKFATEEKEIREGADKTLKDTIERYEGIIVRTEEKAGVREEKNMALFKSLFESVQADNKSLIETLLQKQDQQDQQIRDLYKTMLESKIPMILKEQ